MNTFDFLSSDIEFPCDSNEPKLSSSPCSKLPDPVDWTYHDYYSTVLEKAFTPIQSITDIRHCEPVKENIASPNYLKDWKDSSIFKIHDKWDDQAVILVMANSIQSTPTLQQPLSQQNNLRAALRGALVSVENDMQKNMCDTLRPSTASPGGLPRRPNRDHYLTWKDDILAETLHIGGLPDQDLWDEDGDYLRNGASPVYDPNDGNPILDSSVPSRISFITPLSSSHLVHSSHALSARPLSQLEEIQTPPTITPSLSPSTSLSPPSESSLAPPVPSLSSNSPTKPTKRKSWNVWNKVKQVAQPFTKQFKSPTSSKNAFKRLFQH